MFLIKDLDQSYYIHKFSFYILQLYINSKINYFTKFKEFLFSKNFRNSLIFYYNLILKFLNIFRIFQKQLELVFSRNYKNFLKISIILQNN